MHQEIVGTLQGRVVSVERKQAKLRDNVYLLAKVAVDETEEHTLICFLYPNAGYLRRLYSCLNKSIVDIAIALSREARPIIDLMEEELNKRPLLPFELTLRSGFGIESTLVGLRLTDPISAVP